MACLVLAAVAIAAPAPEARPAPPIPAAELNRFPAVDARLEAQALSEIAVPAGFEASVYASPPVVSHPAALAVAADGTLFVGVDGNGTRSSLPDVGRILRLRDTDGDGRVDDVSAFVPNVPSVRGLVWDRDRLIAMHAPTISAYRDTDGDGVADEELVLVRGVGLPLDKSRVNHGQNGLTAAIDGWIYLALGDQGMLAAEGSDGRRLSCHGGAVVRFRPDGSGLELWATGTRNLYGIVVTPLLDAFARDNSNDGRGWNIRMAHFSGLTEHGYPSLFKNFPDECVGPIGDYVGGAGAGAAWLEAPGVPAEWNSSALTVDYSRVGVFREKLKENGATFSLESEPFIRVSNALAIAVDASGVIYLSTWRGGSWTWDGPTTGLLYRIAPKALVRRVVPRWDRLSAGDLVAHLESPSYAERLEAQRVLLRRREWDGETVARLAGLARDAAKPLPIRVLALFTLKLLQGSAANAQLEPWLDDPVLAPWVLRALGNSPDAGGDLSTRKIVAKLEDPAPRVRKEAIITLARAGDVAPAPVIARRLDDSDRIVAHTAAQALRQLRAAETCFAVLDAASSETQQIGALRVLQTLHDSQVVDGLIARLGRTTSAGTRLRLISALARLHHVEGEWKGEWWGAHVDNTGPYYQPQTWGESAKIRRAIAAVLERAGAAEVVAIGTELQRQGVDAGDAVKRYVAFADAEPRLIPQIVAYFAAAEDVPAAAVPVLAGAAAPRGPLDVRARALTALARSDRPEAWRAVVANAGALLEPVTGASGVPGLSLPQQIAVQQVEAEAAGEQAAVTAARVSLLSVTYGQAESRDLAAATARVEAADVELASRVGAAFREMRRSITPLTEEQGEALAREFGAAPWGRRPARRLGRIAGLGPANLQAIRHLENELADLARAASEARIGLFVAAYARPEAAAAAAERLRRAETLLAAARREALARIQASPARLGDEQIKAWVAQTAAPTGGLVTRTADAPGGGVRLLAVARRAIHDAPALPQFLPLFVAQANAREGPNALFADGVLLTHANRRFGDGAGRAMAERELAKAWLDPARRLQIITAAWLFRQVPPVVDLAHSALDPDPIVARVSAFAIGDLGLAAGRSLPPAESPKVGSLPVGAVLDQVEKMTGDARRGAVLVDQLGCLACHTLTAAEPPKGPFLGALTFPRRELAEAIMVPNKSLAHGFATQRLVLRDGSEVVGFVVRESGGTLTLRNLAAEERRVALGEITRRDVLETSLMPVGLLAGSSLADFASLLDFLEGLRR